MQAGLLDCCPRLGWCSFVTCLVCVQRVCGSQGCSLGGHSCRGARGAHFGYRGGESFVRGQVCGEHFIFQFGVKHFPTHLCNLGATKSTVCPQRVVALRAHGELCDACQQTRTKCCCSCCSFEICRPRKGKARTVPPFTRKQRLGVSKFPVSDGLALKWGLGLGCRGT